MKPRLIDRWTPRLVWAPPGEGDPPADPPADPPPTDPPADPPPADPPAGKWFEADTFSQEEREWLTAKGLATDDAAEALPKLIKGHRLAEQKLGKPAETMLDRPGEGQKVGDWMKENRELFGLAEKLEDLKVERPQMPEGMEYDEGLEAKVREIAFEEGVRPDTLNRLVGAYAEHIGATAKGLDDELQASKDAMNAELAKEWGDQMPAKVAQAKRAMATIAEAAGLDQAGVTAVSTAIAEKGGDAATAKIFAKLGELMSEDQLAGLGKGETRIGTTPADARAELQKLRGPDGDYGKAARAGDRAKMKELQPRIDQLTKIAAGGK